MEFLTSLRIPAYFNCVPNAELTFKKEKKIKPKKEWIFVYELPGKALWKNKNVKE